MKLTEVLYLSVLNYAAVLFDFLGNISSAVRGAVNKLVCKHQHMQQRFLLPSGTGNLIGSSVRRDTYSMPVRIRREHLP